MRATWAWVLGGLAFCAAAPAQAFYPDAIPNGATGGCGVCHIDPAGGGARTLFGQDFERGPNGVAGTSDDHVWSRWLAGRDSDGDGWTNGQELGDPFAYWSSGGSPMSSYRSNPGQGSSEPSNFNLCFSSVYNDCTASSSGGTCSDVYSGSGRFACGCQSGYTGAGHRRTSSHTWTGGAGTQRYSIYSFTYGTRCYDINECAGSNPCGVGSCVNDPGTYHCSCPSGYAAPSSGGTCSDVNECVTTPGICGPGSCSNSIGSYTCSCPGGYDFDGTTCVVTNPCTAGTDDCDRNATCTPVGGSSWNCACFSGYRGTGTPFRGTGDRCEDIDECATRGTCGLGICTNLGGSYACTCPRGYRAPATGGTCTDIDECAETPGLCGAGRCSNRAGGYTCACDPGYMFDGTTCQDIDECAADPCGRGTCVQSFPPPGYGCACAAGYRFDGTTCVDIDECADPMVSNCASDATCTNEVGSFRCECVEGFEGDGFSCVDVDECARGIDTCDPHALCTNSTGSFSCSCLEGWEGSGTICADIDECARGTSGCGAGEICVNREGMPNDCLCAPGFDRDDAGDCVPGCGNGQRTAGEECDDGNTDEGDGCDARCDVEEGFACVEPDGLRSECRQTCGDGWIDRDWEDCDDAEANSDTEPDACRTTCRAAHCGDGVLDTGETCDTGDAVSDEAPDACRTTCVPAFCGDGVVDTGESCDPGGGAPLDASACQTCAGDGGLGDGGPTAVEGGCGCRAAGERGGAPAGLLLLGLLALLRRGARSRRGRPRGAAARRPAAR